jgi:hypothetical protein
LGPVENLSGIYAANPSTLCYGQGSNANPWMALDSGFLGDLDQSSVRVAGMTLAGIMIDISPALYNLTLSLRSTYISRPRSASLFLSPTFSVASRNRMGKKAAPPVLRLDEAFVYSDCTW